MWAALLAFVAKLFGMWINKPPSIVAEAEKAGAAESAVTGMENQHATDIKASAAADAVVRATDTDSKLRDYEARDPHNRDRA